MPFRPFFRSLALPLAAGLLSLGLACKGKHHDAAAVPSDQVKLSGTITFDRAPLLRNTDGTPTGVVDTAHPVSLPAQNVHVVLYEEVPDPNFKPPANNPNAPAPVAFYRVPSNGQATTLRDGTYSLSVTKNVNYMLEVQASASIGVSNYFTLINITADPAGLSSQVSVVNRKRYCFRQDLAGNKPTTASGQNHVAASSIQVDTKLDIHVGVNDTWFLADTDYERNGTLPITGIVPTYSPYCASADYNFAYDYAGAPEATASGSKILAILDSFANLSYSEKIAGMYFSIGDGNVLDLNYVPTVTDPKGTHIEFDRGTYPLVNDATQRNVAADPYTRTIHFLGSIDGTANEAWDDGVLMVLAARMGIFSNFLASSLYSPDTASAAVRPPLPLSKPLSDLHPNLALIEGLSQLMAALAQKNPYLGLGGQDIRTIDLNADRSIYSAPLVRALGWQAALLEHGITTADPAQTPTDWAKLNINNMRAYLTIAAPDSNSDTANLYLQLKALSQAGTTQAGLTPSTIFTTSAVNALLAKTLQVTDPTPYIPWPRPAAGPLLQLQYDWGTNPNGAEPDLTLSMAGAVQSGGTYPNLSHGEFTFARFTQKGAKQYQFTVDLLNGTTPTTLSGGAVELTFISINTPLGLVYQTYTFSTSSPAPTDLFIDGSSVFDTTTFVRIRMISPSTLQPDTTVRVHLVPQS